MSLFAQSVAGLGGITGTVTDSSGARVPDATVVVSNPSKGLSRSLKTNGAGIFSSGSLQPDSNYDVKVVKSGFKEAEVRNITIQVGQLVDLSFNLVVTGSAVEVNVSAEAPVVDSLKTGVSQVVDGQQILNLPINGRRVDAFVLLTPGVTTDGTFGLLSFRGVAGGNAFLNDGNDTTQQYYNENAGRTRISANISQDTVQEFQVITGGSAEFGRASGGVVNTVTKSGGNQVHGTAFWFFRNQNFNARDRYANFVPDETRNQFGGSIGGPIKKDKLFYFFNTEITRRDFPLISRHTNAPLFNSQGQFVATCTATPAACDAARKYIDRFNAVIPRTANQELLFGKIDYQLNNKNTISASFNYLRWISPNGIQTSAVQTNGSAFNSNGLSTVRTRNGRLAWTNLTSPSIVNEFRFGWFKDRLFDDFNSDLLTPGFKGALSINGVTVGNANYLPRVQPTEDRFQFADTLSWTVGRHLFKFGFDTAQTRDVQDQLNGRFGSFVYPTFTAFATDFSNPTAKNWQSYSQTFGDPLSTVWIRDYNLFAQDQFRVNARLTLNYGLRYELANFTQPAKANPEYALTGRIPEPKKNFAPRLGIAYQLVPDKTILRASWGMFYARFPGALITTLNTVNVQQVSINLQSSRPADVANGPSFPGPLPSLGAIAAQGGTSVTYAGPNFRTPYTMQGDIGVEQKIGRKSSLTLSWAFNRGVRLIQIRDANVGALGAPVTYRINDSSGTAVGSFTTNTYLAANRVDTRYQRVNVLESASNLWYNSLLVQFRNQNLKFGPVNGQGSISYTWAHTIDENIGNAGSNLFFNGGPSSLYNGNYRYEKGSSPLDQRHRLVVAETFDFKPYKGGTKSVQYLANDWQLSLLGTFASAFAATPTVSVSGTPFPGAAFNSSFNGLGGDNRVPFLSRASLDIDQLRRIDARITKSFPIKERFSARFSFEAFNLLNTPSDTSRRSGAYILSGGAFNPVANYGEGTQSGGFPDGTSARRLQLSLRLLF